MKCEICGKEYSERGLKSHRWRVHTEQGQKHNPNFGYCNKGRATWNKGLTKETDERVRKNVQSVIETYKNNPDIPRGHPHTEETKKYLSKFGGYKPGSGRGIKGWYKGFWCDSSWELAYVIYCLDHIMPIKRNTKKFKYIFEGKEYSYIPDYELNNQYVEVKGYVNEKWPAKVEQFPYKLTILSKKEMKPILQYVTEKYGKDFIKLYETVG